MTPRADENVVSYSRPQERDGEVVWRGQMDDGLRRLKIFTEFTWLGRKLRPTARPWLLAFLPIAMRSERSVLVLDGPIDEGTLHGVMEWQEMHHRLWPKSTRVVRIRADIEPAPKVPRKAGSLTCFSGGVDSAFTLLRHRPGAPAGGHRQTVLSAGLMVHGFDIPYQDEEFFPRAFARSSQMLEAHGVKPLRMRTNLRQVGRRAARLGWGKVAHGPALAAALAFVEQAHDRVLIPSSYSYEYSAKWGSTTVGDHLLGSEARPFWHDGAGHDKLDKLMLIAQDPELSAQLRVCHEGEQLDRNCGRCYKCVNTQISFWLAGHDAPASFPERATLDDVANMTFKSHYRFLTAQKSQRKAERQGREELAAALEMAIARDEVTR